MGSSRNTLEQFRKQRDFLAEITDRTRERLKNPVGMPTIHEVPEFTPNQALKDREISQKLVSAGRGEPPVLDAVVTANEVNEFHGTGVLLRLVCDNGRDCLSIRSQSHYDRVQEFGRHLVEFKHTGLNSEDLSPQEISESLARTIAPFRIRRILSVPYYPEDIHTTLTLARITGAPLVAWVMDDQTIHESGNIPRELMKELLEAADVPFVISPEMRDAYAEALGVAASVFPPIVDDELVNREFRPQPESSDGPKRAMMVGNIWGKSWLDELRNTVREGDLTVDWFGKILDRLEATPEQLAEDQIFHKGFVSPEELIEMSSEYDFVIVPSAPADDGSEASAIGRFSIPSRIPFIMSCLNLPILVLGDTESAAARFVRRFDVGLTCSYDQSDVEPAIEKLLSPDFQEKARRRCLELGQVFSNTGLNEWIWESAEKGCPADGRFDDLF